jgi:hypothetical protein
VQTPFLIKSNGGSLIFLENPRVAGRPGDFLPEAEGERLK